MTFGLGDIGTYSEWSIIACCECIILSSESGVISFGLTDLVSPSESKPSSLMLIKIYL